jgi:tetratricopeptide (TPR) repeat protein
MFWMVSQIFSIQQGQYNFFPHREKSFGYEELNKGNTQAAIGFFKRNIERNPNSANAFDGIADAYEKAGMWKEALVAAERSVELAQKYDDPNVSYFTGHLKKIKDASTLK